MSANSPFKMKATSGEGGDFEKCPPGNHPAVLVALIDLGHHMDSFKGGAPKRHHKIYLVWELPGEPRTDGEPHVIGERFNLSLNTKSNLRHFIESWRGKKLGDDEEFDLGVTLGKACLLNVVHKKSGERTVANVSGIGPMPKGMPPPKAKHVPFVWFFGGETDYPAPDWVPYCYGDAVADIIAQAEEAKGDAHEAAPASRNGAAKAESGAATAEEDEPIPF